MPSAIAISPHEHLEVVTSTAELLALDCTWTDARELPPAHFHPNQDEHFEVLEGALRVIRDGVETRVPAGESFDVPRGTVHAIIPVDGAARARWEVRPALRTEQFFHAIAAAGQNKVKLLDAVTKYGDEFRLAGALGKITGPISAVRSGR